METPGSSSAGRTSILPAARPGTTPTALARAFAEYAPERVVWGSDYPHVTEKVKPSEAILAEMISQWLPTERSRELALVRNPEEVYGFRAEA